MKKIYFPFLLLCISLSNAQSNQLSISQSSQVCNVGECTTLTANYRETKSTSDYTVSAVDYVPFSYSRGTQLQIPPSTQNQDDFWSSPLTLPFSFCFYGVPYNNVQISSNGVLSFDSANNIGDFSPWLTSNDVVPNPDFRYKNAIYGVLQDLHLEKLDGTISNINYYILDTGIFAAPNRAFVFNTNHLPTFPNNPTNTSGLQTSQIILYETSNIIQINVERRVPQITWESGVGLIGIQNAGGTNAVIPPGRNIGAWSATNESWKFSPSGASTSSVVWHSNGAVVGTGNSIEACFAAQPGNYTATVSHLNCDGNVATLTANFQFSQPANILNPSNLSICADESYPILVNLRVNELEMLGSQNPLNFYFGYYRTYAGAVNQIPSTRIAFPEFYEFNGQPTTIYVVVQDLNIACPVVKSFNINVTPALTTPQGETTQYFTPGQTLNDLEVSGTVIWFDAPNAGNELPGNTLLQAGTTYYAENAAEDTCPTKQVTAERLAVTVELLLRTNEFNLANLLVYPNPAKDNLNISYSNKLNQIEIYNAVGQIIIDKKPDAKEVKLDVSNMASGVYFVKLNSGNQNTTLKFIKN